MNEVTQEVKPENARLYVAIGLLQGVTLWLLYVAGRDRLWPATSPAWFGGLTHFFLAAPLAWFLTAGVATSRSGRTVLAAGIGALLGLLGAHAASTATSGASSWPGFAAVVATIVLSHVLVALVMGYQPGLRRFQYVRLFEFAWRNALLVPAATALTGMFWILLWAAAWVFGAIGLPWLSTVLSEPPTLFIASAVVFALSIQSALRRSAALVSLRQFWLSLSTFFLPLALVLAVLAVAAVAVLGVDSLFATRRAAFLLLWFAALAVLFVNAAYQDGAEPPALPGVVLRLIPWAWLAVPVLVLLGAWSLGLRVHQYGWTPERVWGAMVAVLATVYAFGYAATLHWRRGWMSGIAPTNVAGALLLSLCLVALLSPLADPRKLSVASQVARLHSGATSPSEFDAAFLARGAGRYGRAALEDLAKTSTVAEVRTRAIQALSNDPWVPDRQDPASALAAWDRVRVLPKNASVAPELLQWLARAGADWSERTCATDVAHCAIWIVDVDGRIPAEAVLLSERHGITTATLYAREDAGWRRQGQLAGAESLSDWMEGIDAGTVQWVAPKWQDLMVKGKRLSVR